MQRSWRQVKLLNFGKVFEQFLLEVIFAPGLIRLVALGVTIFAPMTATGINIDAIAVAAGKFFLVSEWAEPFDNAGPGYAKDLLVGFVRQKIPRQSRSLQ